MRSILIWALPLVLLSCGGGDDICPPGTMLSEDETICVRPPDGGMCLAEETCNGQDDDCDGTVDDEGAASCTLGAHATTAACTAGSCAVAMCETGFADCNAGSNGFADGCETPLGTMDNCTSCGEACTFKCTPTGCDDVVAVDAGPASSANPFAATCALTSQGNVYCWGWFQTLPVQAGLRDATAVAVGADHACAVTNGEVWCWGENHFGQLGVVGDRRAMPVRVPGLSAVTSISAGLAHTCAVENNSVYCWGSDSHGQLGNGSAGNSVSPSQVSGMLSAPTAVTAGDLHTCAVTNGAVYCWGDNSSGQLGIVGGGSQTAVQAPLQTGVTTISAGTSRTCAVANGVATCWGAFGNSPPEPAQVPLTNVTSVTVGRSHACALSEEQGYCWGDGPNGELGLGMDDVNPSMPRSFTPTPTLISTLTGLRHITAGSVHTCAVATNGVSCWGSGASGQLGLGELTIHQSVPRPVVPR